MKYILHRSKTRGFADHGWLKSYHSFSFASYYNPERMNFGVLRVLNDDTVDPGMGFETHSHENMEIISIPLKGDLEHKDNMGNINVIKAGDIQVMSAGTGVTHSEYNKNQNSLVNFLQIWIIPNKYNVTPRYDQITLNTENRKNKLQQVLSPFKNDEGVWIYQDAWFYMAQLEKGKELSYQLKDKNKNGVYTFIIDGKLKVNDQEMNTKDGFGLWAVDQFMISAKANTELLLMEVPMNTLRK